ncbi:MAG: polymer-forming cytoskeletal family protein [Nitrospirae bacterium]|nr:MAG: polymer-forming cytoskeletal family protein [Nitrospirota bacterium]
MWGLNGKKKNGLVDEENFTFLGKGVDFKGVVNFDGTVRIDGRLEGEIHTKGTLIVGEHAVIKGLVTTGTLITSGKIQGNITALEKVQILKPGILIGDIHSPSFSMEEGAHFHGMCDMGANKGADQERQDRENVHDLAAHRGKVRVQDLQP